MKDSLSLGVNRQAALNHAAALVAHAWQDFDNPRESETEISDGLIAELRKPLPEQGSDVIESLDAAGDVLDASLAQSRPRYLAYIGSSGLEIGALADLLAHSYDINLALDARAATRLEAQAIGWLADFLGCPARLGSFTSGGTISNITALAAARERALPGTRTKGLSGTRPAIYCSAEAHYSITRAAELLGFGRDAVRDIPIDDQRRMQPAALRIAIEVDLAAGVTPVAVVATAGTTLTGSVDPIAALADICEEFGIWLHIDGAYGLPAASASKTAPLFAGLERADSVSVDAHKWMFVPKACSAVLVRDAQTLARTFAHDEAYIPHEDDELNAVDITLEYSRPLRAMKLWLALRVHGARAFRDAIAENCEQAQHLYRAAERHPEFEVLAAPPQLSIVPFRHVPPGCTDLDAHNLDLCSRMQQDGRVYISPATIDGQVWLRPCFTNFRTTMADVDITLEIAAELGNLDPHRDPSQRSSIK